MPFFRFGFITTAAIAIAAFFVPFSSRFAPQHFSVLSSSFVYSMQICIEQRHHRDSVFIRRR
jgi:hypothetical protein